MMHTDVLMMVKLRNCGICYDTENRMEKTLS